MLFLKVTKMRSCNTAFITANALQCSILYYKLSKQNFAHTLSLSQESISFSCFPFIRLGKQINSYEVFRNDY